MSAADDDPLRNPPRTVELPADLQLAAAPQSSHRVRSEPAAGAAHAARPPVHPARVIAAGAGLCAVVAAIGVGTAALLNEPDSTPSAAVTANHITISTPVPVIPLSDAEIRDLLHRLPDFGALGNASQRASCLGGLGYPASEQVLGAQPLEINARPGVLLVMRGDTSDSLVAYAVALNCSAADTGLLATTAIPRT